MIIAEVGGNILESTAQTLVCPVNTFGAMGKGLALDFRNAYPGLYPAYQQACHNGVFAKKGFFVFTHSEARKILCLPTKHNWKYRSRIEWIDQALLRLVRDYRDYGITSLAVPALGCGLGGLDWECVYNLIKHHLNQIEINVTVYLP